MIGLVGLDCAHPPATEIHPVYALALRTAQIPTAGNIQQKWVFFLRNSGNEGECAEGLHFWDSLNREFSIQLPWPQGATSMSFDGNQSEFFAWDDAAITGDIQQFEKAFTVLKFKFPNDGEFGVDGQVTLNFAVPAEHRQPPKKKPVQVTSSVPQEDLDKDKDEGLGAIGNTISDPAAQAHFKSDLAALGPLSIKPPKKRIPLSMNLTMSEYIHVPGAASRGQLTKTRTVPDPVKQKLAA